MTVSCSEPARNAPFRERERHPTRHRPIQHLLRAFEPLQGGATPCWPVAAAAIT